MMQIGSWVSQNVSYIPILTTQAGSALIAQDWNKAGVTVASYYLSALLVKPGFEILSQLSQSSSLASYVGWDGFLILNASDLIQHKEGHYKIVSSYDGRTHHYTMKQISSLVSQLKPDCFIAPNEFAPDKNQAYLQIESDQPARDGMHGLVYTDAGNVDITRPEMEYAMEPLEKNCRCATCEAGLTRAYLHHLFTHVPGLCQRFLIQHNVCYQMGLVTHL